MDNKEIRLGNLRWLVAREGSAAALGRKLDRSDSQMSQLLKERPDGSRKGIGDRLARDIERKLSLPRGWMDTPQWDIDTERESVHITKAVPVVGSTQGGPHKEWSEMGYEAGFSDEYLDVPSRDPKAYALKVRGNSMAPRMLEGEYILVHPSTTPVPGDEVVVKLKDGSVMVKQLSASRDNTITLDSISRDYDRIVCEQEDIEFIHVVAGVMRATAVRRQP